MGFNTITNHNRKISHVLIKSGPIAMIKAWRKLGGLSNPTAPWGDLMNVYFSFRHFTLKWSGILPTTKHTHAWLSSWKMTPIKNNLWAIGLNIPAFLLNKNLDITSDTIDTPSKINGSSIMQFYSFNII